MNSTAHLDSHIDNFVNRAINLFIEAFDKAGKMIVTHAKQMGSYQDQTTYLRSSIGYLVVKDGVIIRSGGFGTNQGGSTGLEVAQSFIQGSGLELIVVAGMSYARYVEAKNYNVLTSAEHLAGQIVPSMLKQLGL